MEPRDHRKYRDMIHAYELGVLDDASRAEFELHLMECPSCFERVKSFAETAEFLRDDSDVKNLVREKAGSSSPEKSRSRRWWIKLSPAFALAALILIFLLVKPWDIIITPGKEAVASANRLAVIPFENLVEPDDPDNLGRIISSLLIVDLSQSDFLQVISEQRINDQLAEIQGRDTLTPPQLAERISKNLNAGLVLTGTIVQTEPRLVVNATLYSTKTGLLETSGTFSADSASSVFDAADRLAEEIRDSLSENRKEAMFDPTISDITTASLAAYNHYLNGLEYFYHSKNLRAEEEFDKALAEDSTLAMAYYYQSHLKGTSETRRMINLAMKYIDRTGIKERMYIESRHAYMDGNTTEAIAILTAIADRFPDDKMAPTRIATYNYFLGHYFEAIEYFERTLEIDPNYAPALNMLAYCYSEIGELDRALETNEKYIELTPNQPNPYDSRGDIYMKYDRWDDAIGAFENAVAVDSGFFSSLYKVACLYLMKDDYDRAGVYYNLMIGDSNIFTRVNGYNYLSYTYSYQGDLYGALDCLSRDPGDRLEIGDRGEYDYAFYQKAILYDEMGMPDSAIAQIEHQDEIIKRRNPKATIPWAYLYLRMIVEQRQIERAREIAQNIKEVLEKTSGSSIDYFWFLEGIIAYAHGDYGEAVDLMERAEKRYQEQFYFNYHLGMAHYRAGDYVKAVHYFEKHLDDPRSMTIFLGVWRINSYFYLADCYEQLGQDDRALAMYRRFLRHWGDRNPPTEKAGLARDRIERILRSQS